MQVEGDVRVYSYIRQSPKSGWSMGEADSPPSDARIWEDVDEHKVGETELDRQSSPAGIFGYRATCSTVSETVTREAGENSLPAHCSLEAGKEKCSRTRNLGGNGQIEPWRTPGSKSPQGASEEETRGTQLQGQKIAAQLSSPPGPSSKGVLLFNRRKQRVDELTLGGPRAGRLLDGDAGQPRARVADEEAAVPYFEQRASMEEEEELKEVAAEAEAVLRVENRQSETGPEAPVTPVRPPPAQAYLEMPVEARRDAEASCFARPPLPTPPLAPGRTGILEQSKIRKAGWKPMFTFHERPRLAPNPELLSLVHGADVQRKVEGGGRGEAGGDEGLGLGAEACMLAQAKGPAPALAPAVTAGEERPSPEWASCLKPPELRPTRRPVTTPHGLAEVRGKGAELFARRQTRMERYTLEAPTPPPRPPSPTASLPAGWKCSTKPEASASDIKAAPSSGRRHLSSTSFVFSPPPVATGTKLNSKPSPPPPTAAKPQRLRLNGFTTSENRSQEFQPVHASPPDRATLPPTAPRSSEAMQAPRPTFSARRAGLEAQQGWTSPVTPPWKTTIIQRTSIPRPYLETIQPDRASDSTPQSPQTPSYSLPPNSCTPPTEQAPGPSEGQRLKDLLAKNVVSAARRKKLSRSATSPGSPSEILSPFSPRSDCLSPLTTPPSPGSPSPTANVRSPLRLYRRSLTDSEFSLGPEGSGPRSPGYHNFCPRGWTGSRVRQSEQ
ncbi:synaptopodin isoform X1 [Mobula hypostoma]|uniref:synaptopodin isoform X1 n=1 Tax=Mobula hypostoma TaxID=723540 RepID=UPI002FC3A4F0